MTDPTTSRLWSLIRQLQGALGGDRRVRGTVSSSGSVTRGSGWSVVRNGTGDYTVTFDTAFSDTPSVVVGAGATAAFYTAKLHASTPPSASGFRVAVFVTNTTAAADGEWCFIALAP